MMTTITIEIPDQIPQALNRTGHEIQRDVRLYAALMLFQMGKLSSGMSAQMAGIPRVQFLDLCGEYGISIIQLTPEELEEELANAINAAI